MLDMLVSYEYREDFAMGILFWLREFGDITALRFSVFQEMGIDSNPEGLLIEYDFNEISQDAEWRITYNANNRLTFPPPDDQWRDYGRQEAVYDDPELKEMAIRNFLKRKALANYRQQIDPIVTKRGEPIQLFCLHCGMPTETVEDDYLFDTNVECSQCRALQNRGWLEESQNTWQEQQRKIK